MVKFKVKLLFFDHPKVIRALDKVTRERLSKAGDYIRKAAKWSMRPARELALDLWKSFTSKEERHKYYVRAGRARKYGKRRPKHGYVSSLPGQPPRVIKGQLKKFLFHSYDPRSKSVVIGPKILKPGTWVPNVLEFSGKSKLLGRNAGKTAFIKKRPYMGPAMLKEQRIHMGRWARSLNSG